MKSLAGGDSLRSTAAAAGVRGSNSSATRRSRLVTFRPGGEGTLHRRCDQGPPREARAQFVDGRPVGGLDLHPQVLPARQSRGRALRWNRPACAEFKDFGLCGRLTSSAMFLLGARDPTSACKTPTMTFPTN